MTKPTDPETVELPDVKEETTSPDPGTWETITQGSPETVSEETPE